MSFARGFLDKKVKVYKPVRIQDKYSDRVDYQLVKTVCASVKYVHGQRALNSGQLDIYNTVMVRSDWHSTLQKNCRLECEGRYYAIESFNGDKQENEIQITAFEIDSINASVQG